MEVILWIVFGALAGWIASLIAGVSDEKSIATHVAIGVTGAFVGGLLVTFGGQSESNGVQISSLLVAIFGSILILFAYTNLGKAS